MLAETKLLRKIYHRIKAFNYDRTTDNMLSSVKLLEYLKLFSFNDLKRINNKINNSHKYNLHK